jgi:hypothetical protein
MPVDTQTLPGKLSKGQGGEVVASGWCLLAWEMTGQGKPLPAWRGELACASREVRDAAASTGGELYFVTEPYGHILEVWQGPVTVEPVDPADDPQGKRLRLRSAGPLTRSHDDGAAFEHLSNVATGT